MTTTKTEKNMNSNEINTKTIINIIIRPPVNYSLARPIDKPKISDHQALYLSPQNTTKPRFNY